jgi:hypothetical protein
MENKQNLQLELFSSESAAQQSLAGSYNRVFFSRMRRFEKTILTIIVIVTTGIISFSLGVKKGRQRPITNQAQQKVMSIPLAATTRESQDIAKKAQQPLQEEKSQPIYTIQLASYKAKEYAQKEAESLKKAGLTALLLNKGDYIVLCAGSFPNRTAAQTLLSKLKKSYDDCRIRRL